MWRNRITAVTIPAPRPLRIRTAKYKVVDHYKTKLADTYCDDYYEDESDDESGESYDDDYDAGYDAAIAKIKKNL